MNVSIGQHDLAESLIEEFLDRRQRGEHPTIEEYEAKHPELAEELRELLEAVAVVRDLRPGSRDGTGPLVGAVSETLESRPPERVGDYRILREIGRGGMGVVYEADQESLGRRVALKVLPQPIVRDGTALSRFRREARSAARLHHTNIVPVFEVGQDGAICYYAMQFIPGQGLDAVIDDLRRYREHGTFSPAAGPPPPCERVRIAQSMLTGALRPGTPAEDAVPVDSTLISSGVTSGDAPDPAAPAAGATRPDRSESRPAAAVTSATLAGRTDLSATDPDRRRYFHSVARIGHQVAEALAYAHDRGVIHRDVKPSNLLLDATGVVWVTDFGLAKTDEEGLTHTGDILGTLRYMAPERLRGACDVRADIYSLGLTLYELLVLRPAFEFPDRLKLIEQVRHQEPARPRSIDPKIPRDLETIVLKAIAKEPKDRYPSADALADDLRRFLADEPIQARRATSTEQLRRWCRRNPGVATMAAALAVVFLIGFAGVTWKWRDAERQKDLARAAEGKEAAQRAIAVEQANRATAEADRSRRLLYDTEMSLAQQAWETGDTGRALTLLEKQQPRDGQDDLRGFEWRYLWLHCRDASRRSWRGHALLVTEAAFSPDGRTLATSAMDHSLRLWDIASQRQVELLGSLIRSVAFSPDGKTLAFSQWGGRSIRLWDVAAHYARANLAQSSDVLGVAFSPDGKLLAAAGEDTTVRLWDVGTRQEVHTLRGHTAPVSRVAFSPDGRTLASAAADNTVRLWDVAARCAITTFEGHTAPVCSLAFSPDGQLLASAGNDATVRLWDPTTRQAVRTLRGQRTALSSVACFGFHTTLSFSPDGKMMATGGGDGTVRLWDTATKQVSALLRGHRAAVMAVAFAPDGRSLVSGDQSGTLKLWDVASVPDPDTFTDHKAALSSLAWSPDGRTLAVADTHDHTVKLWDTASRRQVAVVKGHMGPVWCVTFAPDGRTLATTSDDGKVRLWDVTSKEKLIEFPQDGWEGMADFSPDGKLLAASRVGGRTVRICDLASRREVVQLTAGHPAKFSPDGRLLAACAGDTVRLWDVGTWQQVATLRGPTFAALSLAFAPDSRTLAVGEVEGTLRLWDLIQKQEIGSRRAHASHIESMMFSPDGRRLATCGPDSMVKLWDVSLLQEVVSLTGHEGPVNSLAFSPDGNTLASASADATVRLWRAPPLDVGLRKPTEAPSLSPLRTIRLFTFQLQGTAQATHTQEVDAHRIDVTAVDGTNWHAQLYLLVDDLQEGATYTVGFRARANAPRSLELGAMIAEGDFHVIGLGEAVPLTKDWRAYQFQFQAKELARKNQIVFNVGERTGTVWIADFALTKGVK